MADNGIQVCVAQLGARMHYGVARLLHEKGLLAHLYTDISGTKGWPRLFHGMPRSIQPKAVRRLMGRDPKGIPSDRLTTFNLLGLDYQFRLAMAKTPSETTAVHLRQGKRFCEQVVRAGFRGASHIYAFSSAALELLQAGRTAGLHTIVEQPSAAREVEREIMEHEYSEFADWEDRPKPDRCFHDFVDRQWEEWEAADTIIVPSEFVMKGLKQIGAPVERCLVVPYGIDNSFRTPERKRHNGPLRVLTVGAVRLLKGPQYVMRAAQFLKGQVEFRWVGPNSLREAGGRELSKHVSLVGQVPRSEIWEHFNWADVFLLPSLCEGMATVLIEALSVGLPVITTPNSGGVIRDGADGFVVPIREPEAIAARLLQLNSDRGLLSRMSMNVLSRSGEFDLSAYAERLCSSLCGSSLQ